MIKSNTLRKEFPYQIAYLFVSLLCAAAVCLHSAIDFPDGGVNFLVEYSFRQLISLRFLLLFAASYALCNLISLFGRKFLVPLEPLHDSFCKPKYFLCAFIPLVISSVICWLQYWPCTGFIDSLYIIYGGVNIYQQHPFWYCLLCNSLYRFASLFFSSDSGRYAVIALFQFLLMDCLIALSAVKLRAYAKKPFIVLYTLFFVLFPLYPLYSITLLKDSLFGLALLWLTFWTLDVLVSDADGLSGRKYFLTTLLIFFSFCALRNNGKYILLLLLITLCIVYRKKRFVFSSCSLLVISLILCIAPNKIMDIAAPQPELFQETVGVPLQQTCAVIRYGNEISAEDSAVLEEIFDLDFVKENFDPYDADVIKWSDNSQLFNNEALTANKLAFIKTWLHLVRQNKSMSIKEWLLLTYGYWAGDSFDNYLQSTMYRMVGNVSATKLPALYDTLHELYYSHAAFFDGGTCLLLLIIFCLLLIRVSPKALLLVLPLLANVLSLFAAVPIAMGYRYIIPYAYVLPALFILVLNNIKIRK